MGTSTIETAATIEAENIGGIDRTEVSLTPGVTLLTGRNATNRTSFLQAVMAALGSEKATLKGDADTGKATLTLGGDEYTRVLRRNGESVTFEGDAYLDETASADLFAFLLGDNEARQAVVTGDDLRDVIMDPVDTGAIQSEIERLERRRRELDAEIDELDELEGKIPELEAERDRLESRLAEKRESLAEKRRELEQADREVDESREKQSELEAKTDELQSTRSSLNRVRDRIETQEASIEALESEIAEHESQLSELSDSPAGERREIETRIEELRGRKASLESTINQLREIVQFNEEMLEGEDTPFDAAAETNGGDAAALTEQLVSDTRVCWTCGSEVSKSDISQTVERLRDLVRERVEERNDVESTLSELTEEKRNLERQQRERESLERKVERAKSELEERKETLEDLRTERDELESDIETIEREVEELRGEEYEAVLDVHKEVNQLEFEVESLEGDVEDIDERIDEITEKVSEREELSERREELGEELTDLRTRIDRLEKQAVEQFNDHMETVLGVLEYENLDRIWIEQTRREVREGRRKVEKGFYDLHIVRSTEDGVSYEDSIEHLSESEREVTGLIFALAGYLVHDVYESCPFMILDSLEAIDSNRIVELVEYFADYTEFLLVALLPEDAEAFDETYERVTEI